MLRPIFGLAAATALLTACVPAARAQVAYGFPPSGTLIAPNGESVTVGSAPIIEPVLQPMFYAAEFLPASPTWPWVIAPRYASALPWTSGLNYGFRTSPYGDYSRYNYWSAGTGPFPGLPRPFIRLENDHWHQKGLNRQTCCP